MIKKILKTFIGAFIFLIVVTNVYADNVCTGVEKSELLGYAANITAQTTQTTKKEPIKGAEVSNIDENYLNLKIYNMNSSLRIELSNNNNDSKIELTYKNMGPDGSITLEQKAFDKIVTYTFDVYGSIYSKCYSEKLRTFKVSLPKYNNLANLEMCEGISDYYLCREYVDFEIDNNIAMEQIKEYKAKLNSEDEDVTIVDNTNVFSKTFSVVSEYKYLITGLIVFIGIVITIVIIRKRRNTL